MCGICGVWGEVDLGVVHSMAGALHHRGPDDSGIYADSQVTLGMTRLAIIDISPAGHQPMTNSDQTLWIVYNGEIYNFHSERRLLEAEGHRFVSNSDTEVVLRMYERYGDAFLTRLRGIFALAIYDKRKGPGRERLLLARDHFGIKPLLFAQIGSRLVFASEIKALLASGLIEREIDPVALRQLLTFGSVYQPRTMLSGVNMLLPAHRLVIEQGRVQIERYWSLGVNRLADRRQKPYHELVAELTSLLEETVRMQMVSDVPLGAFLSGGVDSSLLVALMARAAGSRVKTFSVGFESEGAAIDEGQDAQRTARFLGTDHSVVIVQGSEVRDRLSHIAYSLDQPSVDGVNSYFVSMAARRGVTVAISGTGGDELFAGYPWFAKTVMALQREQEHPWQRRVSTLLAAAARHPLLDSWTSGHRVKGLPDRLTKRLQTKLRHTRDRTGLISHYGSSYLIFGSVGAANMLAPALQASAQAGRAIHYDLSAIDELSGDSTIERISALCLRGYTANQLLRDIDAVSMAHSLEVRVPYLDPAIVNYALSIPDSAKLGAVGRLSAPPHQLTYRESGAKRILIDVARSFLSKDFDLQPKRGFAMPFDAWLRGPLREILIDTLSERQIRERGLLNAQNVLAARDEFLAGNLGWPQPWLLMMLELWQREVLDCSWIQPVQSEPPPFSAIVQ